MAVLTSNGINALKKKDIQTYLKLQIGSTVIPRYKILGYSFSYDKSYGASTMTVSLLNRGGEYSPDKVDWFNSEITLTEGVSVAHTRELFPRFKGLIRQINPVRAGGRNILNLTAFDYILRLQELEIIHTYEGTKTEVLNEEPTPNYIKFYGLINGSPTITSVIYDGDSNEDTLAIGDTLYNLTRGNERTVSSVNTITNIITTDSSSDNWADNDEIVNSRLAQIYDLANSNIAFSPPPRIRVKNVYHNLEDPLWEGYQVIYESGQLRLGKPLNAVSYTIYADYHYYKTADSLYVEDVIEQIITAADGYSNTPFTTVANLTETFSNIRSGAIVDYLTPNSAAEVINGTTYAIGQIWYTKFSNITTTLTSSDFTVPGGTISSVDLRNGRILLSAVIATTSVVTCNIGYSFKTIQATGIQFTYVNFSDEECVTRFEALNTIRKLLAPNYVFMTKGNSKIWGDYITQGTTEDYELSNITSLNYAEDQEIYSRVKVFGKNANPQNILLDPDISFVQDSSVYYGSASNQELTFEKEENGWRIYTTGLSAAGRIVSHHNSIDIHPIVYINNIPIDNEAHQLLMQPVSVRRRETYRHFCFNLCFKTKIRSYRDYWVYFAHSDIVPSQPIIIYKANGTILKTLSAYHSEVNYEAGYWYHYTGEIIDESMLEASTASYYVNYSSGKLEVLYDQAKFKIHTSLFSAKREDIVTADFTYKEIYQAPNGIVHLCDGRWTTQVQTEFYAKPAAGFEYAKIDLGSIQRIDAIDITGGFYYPDEGASAGLTTRKFNINNWYTLQYSTDNVTYYDIARETVNFKLGGGESKSFERDILGENFQTRYLKIKLEDCEKVPYGENGVWVVALSELAAYKNIVIHGEAKLVATEAEVTSTRLYDPDGYLTSLGDKLYKDQLISDILSTQTQVDRRAKNLLTEFYKNHQRLTAQCLYAPHLEIGQTLRIKDNEEGINGLYFIDSIANSNGKGTIGLAQYP